MDLQSKQLYIIVFDKQEYINVGESYENKTATIIEKIVGGKCTPASKEETLIDHIDLHWIYEGNDFPVDVKGPKKYNRWDDNSSNVVWIEGQGITGNPGWIYGKSTFIAFWLKDGITFVYTSKLRNLYDTYLKNKKLYVGTKPDKHYELYRRQGRSDITFTMPVEDLKKIQEYTIIFSDIQNVGIIL